MYVVISYYADGSSKPKVAFCDSADQAISTIVEDTTMGMMTTTYETDETGISTARLICGAELRGA